MKNTHAGASQTFLFTSKLCRLQLDKLMKPRAKAACSLRGKFMSCDGACLPLQLP